MFTDSLLSNSRDDSHVRDGCRGIVLLLLRIYCDLTWVEIQMQTLVASGES